MTSVVVFSLLLGDDEKISWLNQVILRLAEQGGVRSLERFADLMPPAEDFNALHPTTQRDERVTRASFLPLEAYGAVYPSETVGRE